MNENMGRLPIVKNDYLRNPQKTASSENPNQSGSIKKGAISKTMDRNMVSTIPSPAPKSKPPVATKKFTTSQQNKPQPTQKPTFDNNDFITEMKMKKLNKAKPINPQNFATTHFGAFESGNKSTFESEATYVNTNEEQIYEN